MSRPQLIRLAASLLVIALTYGGCEVGSYIYLRIRAGEIYGLYTTHPLLGYFHVPGARIHLHWKEVAGDAQSTQDITINSDGLRDKSRSRSHPPGTYRVLVLGDSIVFAQQVSEGRRFTNLLESKLNSTDHATNYEIINAGGNGYNTALELLFYRNEGVMYQPDLVILAVYIGNDVMENNWDFVRRINPEFMSRPYFTLQQGALQLHNYPVRRSLWESSYLARLVGNELGAHLPGLVRWANRYGLLEDASLRGEYVRDGFPLHMGVYARRDDADWQNAYAVTTALIAKFQAETTKHHSRLLVLLIPDKLQLGNEVYWEWTDQYFPSVRRSDLDMEKPNRIVQAWCVERGIELLDLRPEFEQSEMREGQRLYFKVDVHLNERGHEFVAERLADPVRQASRAERPVP